MGNTQQGGVGIRVTGDDFEVQQLIGKGAFGKVWKVKKKDTGEIFAMKSLSKDAVVEENLIEHTIVEREIMLSMGHHPFIVNLNYAFQTDTDLYFVLEYVGGGSLMQLLQQCPELKEKEVKFYAAEILLGLEALHTSNIIYRDLKLENVLISAEGHAVLTDFGLSAKLKSEQHTVRSFSGTAIYLAPEILLDQEGKGHGKSVDWWGFGVLLHILFTGAPPFWSENHKELYDLIMAGDLLVHEDPFLTESAKALLIALLERDVTKRLGCGPTGAEEVKKHPFFNGVDWDAVYRKEYKVPHIPEYDIAEEAKKKYNDEGELIVGKKKKDDRRFRGFSFVGDQTNTPLKQIQKEIAEAKKSGSPLKASSTCDVNVTPTTDGPTRAPKAKLTKMISIGSNRLKGSKKK